MNWVNAAVFLVLIAGHTELWVTLINRSHGLPLRGRFLRHLRHFHDVWIPVFPFVLVWFVGLSGPAVLRGGSWADVPAGWSVYLALCAAGAIGLVVHIARGRRAAPPAL
ncbi:MAG TPA: hypothetical protein EYP14_11920, partial [Planctomycetaceae bacterium]|nr:hypothetical protein [Planctomycetaceae bacterium]